LTKVSSLSGRKRLNLRSRAWKSRLIWSTPGPTAPATSTVQPMHSK
jgi:hypothetical protein